jgi:hypothetical protein
VARSNFNFSPTGLLSGVISQTNNQPGAGVQPSAPSTTLQFNSNLDINSPEFDEALAPFVNERAAQIQKQQPFGSSHGNDSSPWFFAQQAKDALRQEYIDSSPSSDPNSSDSWRPLDTPSGLSQESINARALELQQKSTGKHRNDSNPWFFQDQAITSLYNELPANVRPNLVGRDPSRLSSEATSAIEQQLADNPNLIGNGDAASGAPTVLGQRFMETNQDQVSDADVRDWVTNTWDFYLSDRTKFDEWAKENPLFATRFFAEIDARGPQSETYNPYGEQDYRSIANSFAPDGIPHRYGMDNFSDINTAGTAGDFFKIGRTGNTQSVSMGDWAKQNPLKVAGLAGLTAATWGIGSAAGTAASAGSAAGSFGAAAGTALGAGIGGALNTVGAGLITGNSVSIKDILTSGVTAAATSFMPVASDWLAGAAGIPVPAATVIVDTARRAVIEGQDPAQALMSAALTEGVRFTVEQAQNYLSGNVGGPIVGDGEPRDVPINLATGESDPSVLGEAPEGLVWGKVGENGNFDTYALVPAGGSGGGSGGSGGGFDDYGYNGQGELVYQGTGPAPVVVGDQGNPTEYSPPVSIPSIPEGLLQGTADQGSSGGSQTPIADTLFGYLGKKDRASSPLIQMGNLDYTRKAQFNQRLFNQMNQMNQMKG